MAGRPALFTDENELQKAIDEYFEKAVVQTVSGLAYHLGFESRQSLYDYAEREQFSYIIKRAKFRVESSYEEKLSNQSCTGAIFALKNMGWKDKTEVDSNVTMGITWNEEKTYEADQETDHSH